MTRRARDRGISVGCLAVGLWVTASALLAWAGGGLLARVQAPGPARVEDLLAVGAAAAAEVVLTWLAAGVVATVLAATSRYARSAAVAGLSRTTPAVLRRVTVAALGATVAIAPATAHAASAPPERIAALAPAVATAVPLAAPATAGSAAGWSPDRPARPPHRQAGTDGVRLVTSPPRQDLAVRDDVVVRCGDTLWDIAARALGGSASDAEIAVEWPRWYAANRAAIGPDPGLIVPGQVLQAPAAG
jgi:nucleoid-associated protein YgaU